MDLLGDIVYSRHVCMSVQVLKAIDFVNDDNQQVYDYVVSGSPAEKNINEFDNQALQEEFLELEVYGIYIDGNSAYAAVFEKLKKDKNGSDTIKAYKWVYNAIKIDDKWLIYSYNSKIPSLLLNKLSTYVNNNQYESSLADVISKIWITNEQTSFSYGQFCQDLAFIRIAQGIKEYSLIKPLQPQDGVDLHQKDYWQLDIAAMHAIIGEYEKAIAIYDAVIEFNDVNVIGACLGKADIFRRQGNTDDMILWMDKAKLAADNGDMLP